MCNLEIPCDESLKTWSESRKRVAAYLLVWSQRAAGRRPAREGQRKASLKRSNKRKTAKGQCLHLACTGSWALNVSEYKTEQHLVTCEAAVKSKRCSCRFQACSVPSTVATVFIYALTPLTPHHTTPTHLKLSWWSYSKDQFLLPPSCSRMTSGFFFFPYQS